MVFEAFYGVFEAFMVFWVFFEAFYGFFEGF
jgi:hypothetical protein